MQAAAPLSALGRQVAQWAREMLASLNTTAGYLKADDEWCRSEHRNSHPLNKPAEG